MGLIGPKVDNQTGRKTEQETNSALSALLYAAVSKVESLRRSHLYCEDSWYSCPKHEDGCSNDAYDADECNCGADEENKTIDEIVELLNKAKGI